MTEDFDWSIDTQVNNELIFGSYNQGGVYAGVVDDNDVWAFSLISTKTILELFPDATIATVWAAFLWDQGNSFVGVKSATIGITNKSSTTPDSSGNAYQLLQLELSNISELNEYINILMSRTRFPPPDNINSGGRLLYVGVTF